MDDLRLGVSKYYFGKYGWKSSTIYYAYRKTFKRSERKSEQFVSRKVFLEILEKFNLAMFDLVINKAFEFKIPWGLGNWKILRFIKPLKLKANGELDVRNMSPDWGKTWKLWSSMYPGKSRAEIRALPKDKYDKPMVWHENKHTDGYQMKFFWEKLRSKVVNKSVYCFELNQACKKKLSQAIFKNRGVIYEVSKKDYTRKFRKKRY